MFKIIGGDGNEYGPVPAEQLQQWIREGRANAQTKVRRDDSAYWKTVADFPELNPAPPPAVSPPPVPMPAVPAGNVSNYLWQSIAVTLCCCLPLGIPAIVFAAQVNTKLAAGDVAGAQEASRKAKLWCWIAFGLGVAANIITALFYFFVGMAQWGSLR
jgi:hypothetical protein